MTDELQSEQPVSVHDTPHVHHGALPLIAAMLGVFLVLETVALGYLVKTEVLNQEAPTDKTQLLSEAREQIETRIQEVKDKVPPLLYAKNNNEIYQIDRITGAERLVYTGTGILGIFAVPQIDYDGRVFLTSSCSECDSPNFAVLEYDLKADTTPTNLEFQNGSFARGSAIDSADGTKLAAAVYDNEELGHAGKVYLVDLLTGEEEMLGTLAADEYFSSAFGENVFGYTNGFTLSWQDRECVNVYIYQDDPLDLTDPNKQFKENRTFCSAE